MKRLAAILLLLLSVSAVLLTLFSPAIPDREAVSSGPSRTHLAGTDELGRDRARRTAQAFLLGMAGAVAAAAVTTGLTTAAAFGAAVGSARVRAQLLYVSDLFLTLPWLFLLMLVRSALPLSMPATASAMVSFGLLAALGWPIYVRSATARIDALHRADWLLQARATGMPPLRLLRVHVLPHARPVLLTQFLLAVPTVLLAEANLGSLGLGVGEPLVSWGSLVGEAAGVSAGAGSRWAMAPLLVLVLTMFCIETLGAEEL